MKLFHLLVELGFKVLDRLIDQLLGRGCRHLLGDDLLGGGDCNIDGSSADFPKRLFFGAADFVFGQLGTTFERIFLNSRGFQQPAPLLLVWPVLIMDSASFSAPRCLRS